MVRPLRASTRTMARSAVDAAVAMLRVYCSCPGASASRKRRLGVEKARRATSIVMPARAPPPAVAMKAKSSIPSALSEGTRRSRPAAARVKVDLPSSTEPQVRRRAAAHFQNSLGASCAPSRRLVAVDQAALPFENAGCCHFGEDVVDARRLALDRAAQGVTAKVRIRTRRGTTSRPLSDGSACHPQSQRPVALHGRTLGGE